MSYRPLGYSETSVGALCRIVSFSGGACSSSGSAKRRRRCAFATTRDRVEGSADDATTLGWEHDRVSAKDGLESKKNNKNYEASSRGSPPG